MFRLAWWRWWCANKQRACPRLVAKKLAKYGQQFAGVWRFDYHPATPARHTPPHARAAARLAARPHRPHLPLVTVSLLSVGGTPLCALTPLAPPHRALSPPDHYARPRLTATRRRFATMPFRLRSRNRLCLCDAQLSVFRACSHYPHLPSVPLTGRGGRAGGIPNALLPAFRYTFYLLPAIPPLLD